MQHLVFWPHAGAWCAGMILPPCAQLLWCELHVMKSTHTKKAPTLRLAAGATSRCLASAGHGEFVAFPGYCYRPTAAAAEMLLHQCRAVKTRRRGAS